MNPGARVGSYILVRSIGAGGMGEVWLAEHVMLSRRAAIKLLHPSLSTRSEIVTRFFNEARAATAIADPGIVQVFDFGHADDGTAYIVMELLDGETLDARCRKVGLLPVADALRITRQVASSLGAAHARGIVHRDLKPENIFLVRDPEVAGGERAKILDFGIAKLTGDAGVKTQTSAVMGTPTFMSPEQCRGAGGVDARSDVYSLGCVLFAILTGRPPFVGDGVGDLIVMHMREPAPIPSSLVPSIPPAVDALIARCLDKDPARRFASGGELAIAIDGVRAASHPTIAVHASETPPIAIARTTTLSGAAGSVVAPSSSRRGWWLAGVATLALAGGGIALVATRGGEDASPTGRAATEPDPTALPPDPAATIDAAPIAVDVDAAIATAVDASVPPADAASAPADAASPPADAAPARRSKRDRPAPSTTRPQKTNEKPTSIDDFNDRSLPQR